MAMLEDELEELKGLPARVDAVELQVVLLRDDVTGLREEMREGFERVDERFGQVDERFEQVDERFGQVNQRFGQVNQRFDQVDRRFDQTDSTIETRGLEMHAFVMELYKDLLHRIKEGDEATLRAVEDCTRVLRAEIHEQVGDTRRLMLTLHQENREQYHEVLRRLDALRPGS